MNKYLKNLNRIEFVVTSACTGNCKHCSQGDHESADSLDSNISSEIVRTIAGEYDIKSVMTFGGEPLLYPDTVCEIHKAAKEMNIPKRQLITNGYFSKDSEFVKSVAEKLAESGVNEILLSVDAFHQETIPLEYVIMFAESVKNAGIKILAHPAWLVSPDDDNAYNIRTRKLLDKFIGINIGISDGNVVFPAGNALKHFLEYFDLSSENPNPYIEDPTDIKAICISANGDLLNGNIYSSDVDEILDSYIPK